jgi:hypothetical protein
MKKLQRAIDALKQTDDRLGGILDEAWALSEEVADSERPEAKSGNVFFGITNYSTAIMAVHDKPELIKHVVPGMVAKHPEILGYAIERSGHGDKQWLRETIEKDAGEMGQALRKAMSKLPKNVSNKLK